MSSFALSTIIRSGNEPMTSPLTSWLVPSFLQHNVRLVVSGHCLHISVTNFQDKFVSLQQVNSPNGWDKFQICYTYMYLIRFLLNFAVLFLHVFWEFHGSVTAQNIRSSGCIKSLNSIQSTLSKTHTFGTSTKCPSYRESNKGSKERQGPTWCVRFTEVSVL